MKERRRKQSLDSPQTFEANKNASCEIATKRPKGQIILIATEICTRVNIEHSM